MKLETGNWTIGRALLIGVWMGLCIAFVMVGFVGCSTVGPLIEQNLPALTNAIPEPGAGEPAVATDELSACDVKSYEDSQVDWLKWPVTQSLKADLGGNLILTTEAVKVWKDGGGNVCANLHFIVKRDGQWRAYCFDYVRPGQIKKDGVPRSPCKEGKDYETVSKDEECYICLTGLCRDKRRNVSERTNIVRVQ